MSIPSMNVSRHARSRESSDIDDSPVRNFQIMLWERPERLRTVRSAHIPRSVMASARALRSPVETGPTGSKSIEKDFDFAAIVPSFDLIPSHEVARLNVEWQEIIGQPIDRVALYVTMAVRDEIRDAPELARKAPFGGRIKS